MFNIGQQFGNVMAVFFKGHELPAVILFDGLCGDKYVGMDLYLLIP